MPNPLTSSEGGPPPALRSVLITGCSSGIGEAAARRFARKGWRVFASVRRVEGGARLRDEAAAEGWRLTTPELDVTSDGSVERAVGEVLAAAGGRLDVLVNNAGYYCYGPIEETSPDELRAQIETNVIGVLRVTRAVLPAMRARGEGAVVNVGSVAGRVAIPVAGPYHTSKWALECLTETLRYELAPFGIRVALVEPGPFKSRLHAKEVRVRDAARPDSPYRDLVARYEAKSKRIRREDLDPLIDVLYRAATDASPRLRWPVGPTSLAGTLGRRLTPDRLYEWVVKLVFRLRR